MAKVLWISDGGSTTGFGRVTHSIGERLVRDFGHEIHVLATNFRGDAYPSILDKAQQTLLRLYVPNSIDRADVYGRSRIIELLAKVEPDVVVIVNDPMVIMGLLLSNPYDTQKLLLGTAPLLTYIPVDGINLPPVWTDFIPKVSKVIAMSKWGQQAFDTNPEAPAELVYHGVDTDQFYPVDDAHTITVSDGSVLRTKKDCKRKFGFDPEGFLVLRVDSNSGRKDYPASYKALVPFMESHGDVQVHFHGAATNSQSGVNFGNLWSRSPQFKPGERWFVPDLYASGAGWPQENLLALYNAADVYLSTSRGEGFGLGLAESLACGVPVIAQNVSAIPEVVGPGGILLEPLERLITVPAGQDTWLADIPAFTDALEMMYRSRRRRRDMGDAGREHVLTSFRWDEATQKFDKHIGDLAAGRLSKTEPVAAQVASAG